MKDLNTPSKQISIPGSLDQTAIRFVAPVHEDESGQKLLRFLERRLNLAPALLHRWIRTGQTRINGKRCKPFDRVRAGDIIRLPPFAEKLAMQNSMELPGESIPPSLPPLIGSAGEIWAFNKPCGLPVQSGTGHADSLAARLSIYYGASNFKPAPAHRLDRDTTGVVLVGASYDALHKLQDDFQQGKIRKEYLAWVQGKWPWEKDRLLCHYLRESRIEGVYKMEAHDMPEPGLSKAMCLVRPVRHAKQGSLLHILLLTGRKHQLRVQLAHCGYAVSGDGKYGSKAGQFSLKLHSMRVLLADGSEFACLPPWKGNFAVNSLPGPIACCGEINPE